MTNTIEKTTMQKREVLVALLDLQEVATEEQFEFIFDVAGPHLYNKFVNKHKRNILLSVVYLDLENLRALFSYLEGNTDRVHRAAEREAEHDATFAI